MAKKVDLLKQQVMVPKILWGALVFSICILLYLTLAVITPLDNIDPNTWYFTAGAGLLVLAFNIFKLNKNKDTTLLKVLFREIDLNASLSRSTFQESYDLLNEKDKRKCKFFIILHMKYLLNWILNHAFCVLGFVSVRMGMPAPYFFIIFGTSIVFMIMSFPRFESTYSKVSLH